MTDSLEIRHLDKGQWVIRELTMRQFLSLLFGYCSAISMILFLFSLIVPFLIGPDAKFEGASFLLQWVGFVIFLFLLFHMLVATFLGMYYLSDKMHRPEE
ncbi:hypothetical protein [Xinfangfangia pollutisoli]|uniref:hypothetical protein n=1 Tax=Xinfangfangia pollutisoli TaxID=2865960 RepID=UPI001CD25289|nr:hypothetical protein [Xinfangfangia pollutisoli]